MCQQQAKQEHDDYWQAVTDVAENVVADLDADGSGWCACCARIAWLQNGRISR